METDHRQKIKTGLFFGSFNPVHVGHMIIANYMVEHTDMKEVWLVVSPHNPHKERKTLARDHDRLHLVHLAIGDNVKLRASNIEFSLPKPSYTVDTLAYLREKYPDREFALIMGGDNLSSLHKWKNFEVILNYHEIFVYNRPGYEASELSQRSNIHYVEAPLLDISASFIRQLIRQKKSIQYLVPDAVFEYLDGSSMYT
jgi:nicotinate-nucleotide adenylyltransferase